MRAQMSKSQAKTKSDQISLEQIARSDKLRSDKLRSDKPSVYMCARTNVVLPHSRPIWRCPDCALALSWLRADRVLIAPCALTGCALAAVAGVLVTGLVRLGLAMIEV